MKKISYLGKKSISTILRYVVNVLWYFQLVVVCLILVKSLINSFTPDNSFSWPVSFVATIQENIVSPKPDFTVKGIKVTNGTLSFDTRNNRLANVIMFLGIFLMALPFLIVTYQARKILKSFTSNDPFLKSNLRRIRFIGIVMVPYPLVAYVFGIFYTHYLNSNFEGYEFVNSINLLPLFFGLFALVVSEVFRLGIEYREENDLTI